MRTKWILSKKGVVTADRRKSYDEALHQTSKDDEVSRTCSMDGGDQKCI
jgi:hypothetical protein